MYQVIESFLKNMRAKVIAGKGRLILHTRDTEQNDAVHEQHPLPTAHLVFRYFQYEYTHRHGHWIIRNYAPAPTLGRHLSNRCSIRSTISVSTIPEIAKINTPTNTLSV